jgi:hypothetical protein
MADEELKPVLVKFDQATHDEIREIAEHYGASIRGTIVRHVKTGILRDQRAIDRELEAEEPAAPRAPTTPTWRERVWALRYAAGVAEQLLRDVPDLTVAELIEGFRADSPVEGPTGESGE